MVCGAATSRSSGGRSAVHTSSGTSAWLASTTAACSSTAAVPLVHSSTAGRPVARPRPSARNDGRALVVVDVDAQPRSRPPAPGRGGSSASPGRPPRRSRRRGPTRPPAWRRRSRRCSPAYLGLVHLHAERLGAGRPRLVLVHGFTPDRSLVVGDRRRPRTRPRGGAGRRARTRRFVAGLRRPPVGRTRPRRDRRRRGLRGVLHGRPPLPAAGPRRAASRCSAWCCWARPRASSTTANGPPAWPPTRPSPPTSSATASRCSWSGGSPSPCSPGCPRTPPWSTTGGATPSPAWLPASASPAPAPRPTSGAGVGRLDVPVLVLAGELDAKFAAIGTRAGRDHRRERPVRDGRRARATPPTWSSRPRSSRSFGAGSRNRVGERAHS